MNIAQDIKQSKIGELTDLISQYEQGKRDNLNADEYPNWVIIVNLLRENEIDETLYQSFLQNPSKFHAVDKQIIAYTEDELTVLRKENFENTFITTSLGNYRLNPKGYANAQQSIDTINNIVAAIGSLTEDVAKMIIFYETPDFTKEEECTEEWLVQHQYSPDPMTKEEWTTFYIEFTTLYAQKQYMLSQQ